VTEIGGSPVKGDGGQTLFGCQPSHAGPLRRVWSWWSSRLARSPVERCRLPVPARRRSWCFQLSYLAEGSSHGPFSAVTGGAGGEDDACDREREPQECLSSIRFPTLAASASAPARSRA
jgi:hypothetical protein